MSVNERLLTFCIFSRQQKSPTFLRALVFHMVGLHGLEPWTKERLFYVANQLKQIWPLGLSVSLSFNALQ